MSAIDLCVVGAGPGGMAVATLAAEAGLKVVVVEAGDLVTPADCTQREEDMLPRLLWHAGARTTADRRVRVVQGQGVGGSSLHNLNLCKRIPRSLRDRWPLEHLPPERWEVLYDEVEALLGVSTIPEARQNEANRLLRKGCEGLGWRGGALRHNRTGCVGSGFCALGCAYDAKNNALKVFARRFVAAGGELRTLTQAVRIRHRQGRVAGLSVAHLDGTTRRPVRREEILADRICLAASATGTAAILQRSRVPGEVGQSLHLHPGAVVVGDFEQPVRAWTGIPQSYECTEWIDFEQPNRRAWITAAFAHPASAATMVPGHGASHRDWMTRYAHLLGLGVMIHDETRGTVETDGDLGLRIDYHPGRSDQAQLVAGMRAAARLLFAAGARRVLIPSRPPRVIHDADAIGEAEARALAGGRLELTAVHPMGTVPMGDDPENHAVDSRGRHHHLRGLWVGDGSLFPGSIGVPPQLSIYALGLHVGRSLLEAIGSADPP